MDQLCIAAGRPGHAALIDCRSLDVRHIGLPAGLEVVVEFVAARSLVGTEYSDRVAQTARVEEIIGPLRDATEADLTRIDDDLLRRRARHVITENQRVLEFAAALEADERGELGRLMNESHRSLSEDFETSNPTMDAAVRRLREDPAVHGARITGGGFGGCVVALRSQSRRRRFWRSNSSSVIVPRSRSASHFSN